jgi:glycine betaine/proline transport system substrate-binding protein
MKIKMIAAASAVVMLTACGDSTEKTAQSTTPETGTNSCGTVTIAEMNWSSASLMANVDQFILQNGYGCDAKLVSGDTMPTSTSMIEKGEPDIAPELWSNGLREPLDKGVAEGRLKYASDSLSDGGEEGLWVPQYMVDEDPSLATLEGIKAKADLFKHPEDPDASMLMGCPAGWNCHITVKNLFKALELEEAGFKLVDPGSGAALAGAIAKAYERKEPWFGYYWSPTAVLGKYQMTKVDFGSGVDKEHYDNCITQEDCADPKPTMWPPSAAQAVTTASFAERAPEAFAYISKRSYTNAKMNKLLAWMEENQADGATAAAYFLETDEATWSAWVAPEVAERVKAALASN